MMKVGHALLLSLALMAVVAAQRAFASGGSVPPDRLVYVQPGSWCPDAQGDLLEYPVLYAYGKRARLGPVAPASCALIDGYTARATLHLRCERAGTWSPPVVLADAAFKALVTPHCRPGTSQDFR